MARVTVEDCLIKIPSRFALVIAASRRARQLLKGAEPKIKGKNKAAVTALREISAGAVYVEQDVQALIEQYVEASRPRRL